MLQGLYQGYSSYLNVTGAFTSENINCTTLNSFTSKCRNLNTTGNVGTGTNVPYTNLHFLESDEQNKEEILKYRRERYRTIHKKDLNIKVSTGTFTL